MAASLFRVAVTTTPADSRAAWRMFCCTQIFAAAMDPIVDTADDPLRFKRGHEGVPLRDFANGLICAVTGAFIPRSRAVFVPEIGWCDRMYAPKPKGTKPPELKNGGSNPWGGG